MTQSRFQTLLLYTKKRWSPKGCQLSSLASWASMAIVVTVSLVSCYPLNLWYQAKAEETLSEMVRLSTFLHSTEPDSVDHEKLLKLMDKSAIEINLVDGWGNSFQIERHVLGNEGPYFTVRSLGKDGKKGACCKRWVTDWNDDAVIEREIWLQAWE